jgi:transcriptional regulator with XRE-family HTH domain
MSDEVGRRLRQIRHARRKSLAVVAGRAGISVSYLSRLESGERALDRRSLIVSLAEALEVAPSEITGPGLATTGRLEEDGSLNAVRLALWAAVMNEPRGQVLPEQVLEARVTEVLEAQAQCRYADVGAALPALLRDLHTTEQTGRNDEAVLRLLAVVHVQGVQAWLMDIGASMDLTWQAVVQAQRVAERLDDSMVHAISAFGTAFGLMGAGAFDLAAQALDRPRPGTGTSDAMQVSGMLALASSLVAAASGDATGRQAAIDHASDLATHTGEGNALWLGFGPSNVGVWRMSVALEAGDHHEAVRIAESVDPRALPSLTRRAAYWREYGRALAHSPRRHDEAVLALRQAERISPARIHRHPFMRSVLSELLVKAKRNSVGRELRGMAYRAGLPV